MKFKMLIRYDFLKIQYGITIFFCFTLLPNLFCDPLKEDLKGISKESANMVLGYLQEAADEESGLWMPPKKIENVKYEKTGVFRLVDEPILKVVGYKDVMAWVKTPTADDPYKKVYKKIKKPIYKKVGVKKVKREKYKASSTKSSVTILHTRWEQAINAFPAYAIMTAETNTKVKKLDKSMEWLIGWLEKGLPDNTIDLCASTLALMKYKQLEKNELIQNMLYKILKGQINKGSAKGLWGYYCVNWQDLQKIEKFLDKAIALQAKLQVPNNVSAGSPSKKYLKLKEKYDALGEAISWLIEKRASISSEFYKGRLWFKSRRYKVEDLMGDALPHYHSFPKMLYEARERSEGDIFYTQLALFTLSEAKKGGFLNSAMIKSYNKRQKVQFRKARLRFTFPKFPDYNKILTITAAVINKEQNKDGFWKDFNKKVKIKSIFPELKALNDDMKKLPEKEAKNIKKHEYPVLDSKNADTISAMHCYALLSKLCGAKKIKTRYKASIEKGLKSYNEILNKTITSEDWQNHTDLSFMPYTLLFSIPDVNEEFGLDILKEENGVKKIIAFIEDIQNGDGSFNDEEKPEYKNIYKPHPLHLESSQEEWIKLKIRDDWSMHTHVNPQILSTAAIVYVYQRMIPGIFKNANE